MLSTPLLILQSSGPDTYQKSHLWRWAYSDILILIASSFLRLRNDSSVGNHLGCLAWSILMQNKIMMLVLPPGMTPELEIILAEGAGMEPGYSSDKVSISVSPSSLSSYTHDHHHRCRRYPNYWMQSVQSWSRLTRWLFSSNLTRWWKSAIAAAWDKFLFKVLIFVILLFQQYLHYHLCHFTFNCWIKMKRWWQDRSWWSLVSRTLRSFFTTFTNNYQIEFERIASWKAWWGNLWGAFCDCSQEPRHALYWTLQVD